MKTIEEEDTVKKEKRGIQFTEKTLSKQQEKSLEELLKKYEDVFSKGDNDIGKTEILKMKIDTEEAKPIKQKAYRYTKEQKEEISKQIKELMEKGIIRRSYSPWSSPVVMVKKKNGKWRMCTNFMKVNEVIKKDNYPLPRIDELLGSFEGKKFFSGIDLTSGFYNVEIEEEDKEKTAIITHEGLYEYNRMQFGLCNAPAVFQRMMHIAMEELLYRETLVYIDDLVIFSDTFEEHLTGLEKVLQKLRKAKLKINRDKSNFGYRKIEFLGHYVGEEGIEVNNEKIEVVKNFPRPGSVSELRRFIGLVSYYRKFIKDFAKIAKPLTKLFKDGRREKKEKGKSKKQNKFKRDKYRCKKCYKNGHYEEECFEEIEKWGKEQEESFQLLKEKLITAPILRHPNFKKEFWISTDASGHAMGAILKQKGENEKDEHVIEYASISLTEAEQKWSTTELECFAVIWAMRKFHYYIAGKRFKVITDHYALKWLKKNAHKGRKARWFEEIQENDFEIIHKEGKKHQDVDALSRIKIKRNNNKNIKNDKNYEKREIN